MGAVLSNPVGWACVRLERRVGGGSTWHSRAGGQIDACRANLWLEAVTPRVQGGLGAACRADGSGRLDAVLQPEL